MTEASTELHEERPRRRKKGLISRAQHAIFSWSSTLSGPRGGEMDMSKRSVMRMVAGAAMTGAVVLTSAGPAFAHFCRKIDFNPTAAAHAGASKAWLTADEWRAFLPFIEPQCEGITGAIEPILSAAEASGTTLFLGPGLLAGGTLKNGKGNTPEHFAYMLDAFIEHCPSE